MRLRQWAWVVSAIFCSVSAIFCSAAAQAEDVQGHADYQQYCSACHGEAADGNGPVANVLTPRPPSLTDIGAKYGRPLATDLVVYVMGDTMPRAHGTSDMPVWGRNLQDERGNDEKAVATIWRIANYLQSLQPEFP